MEMMCPELNNPRYIEDALTMHVSEIEPLYWAMEDAFHKGDQSKAKAIYELFFLYIAKYHNDLLREGLRDRYIKRLKEIAYEIQDGASTKERKSITIKQSSLARPLPFEKESMLRDFLAGDPQILSSALGTPIKILGTEVTTDCEYRCDIVAESEETCFPIELKIVQANHAVISQISKYCYYFYRRYRYSNFKDIQGVVCANGYCQWSINELRRENIWIFSIVPNGDSIKLVRIP